MQPIQRLTPSDIANLEVEAPDTPMHQAALGVLDGAALLDADGHVRIDMVRAHIEARIPRVPELRRVLRRAGPLGGELWVDDVDFRIENHVLLARLPAPGGEEGALEFAQERLETLMDRSRPLWEIWLLEGYATDRVGVLVKLHHALADGPAMVNIVGRVFDLEPEMRVESASLWSPASPPTPFQLFGDNLQRLAAWIAAKLLRLRHPVTLLRTMALAWRGAVEEISQGSGAPATSLNRPIGISRRVAVIRLPLGVARAVAHREGVKLNDVFLTLVAGGLRDVLLSRGEPVRGVRLRASVAVSLHQPGDGATSGNLIGTVIVPLPVDCDDARMRLDLVAQSSARAKSTQGAVLSPRLMVWLARLGLTRLYIRRQHFINVLTTNLPGPPVPLYLAGARLIDAVAMPPIAGNVTASFAALSYCGTLSLSVVADASAWPDLGVLKTAMRRAWLELQALTDDAIPA